MPFTPRGNRRPSIAIGTSAPASPGRRIPDCPALARTKLPNATSRKTVCERVVFADGDFYLRSRAPTRRKPDGEQRMARPRWRRRRRRPVPTVFSNSRPGARDKSRPGTVRQTRVRLPARNRDPRVYFVGFEGRLTGLHHPFPSGTQSGAPKIHTVRSDAETETRIARGIVAFSKKIHGRQPIFVAWARLYARPQTKRKSSYEIRARYVSALLLVSYTGAVANVSRRVASVGHFAFLMRAEGFRGGTTI